MKDANADYFFMPTIIICFRLDSTLLPFGFSMCEHGGQAAKLMAGTGRGNSKMVDHIRSNRWFLDLSDTTTSFNLLNNVLRFENCALVSKCRRREGACRFLKSSRLDRVFSVTDNTSFTRFARWKSALSQDSNELSQWSYYHMHQSNHEIKAFNFFKVWKSIQEK